MAMGDAVNGQAGAESSKLTLKQLRLRQALSVNELAAQAGVVARTILLIERGEVSPHMATIRKLSRALNCAPDAIAWPDDPFAD
jgi:transcriptional regulator with XRE-family HTH domain